MSPVVRKTVDREWSRRFSQVFRQNKALDAFLFHRHEYRMSTDFPFSQTAVAGATPLMCLNVNIFMLKDSLFPTF
jgi:hypothetical protein